MNPYAQDLDRNDANYAPLTPRVVPRAHGVHLAASASR